MVMSLSGVARLPVADAPVTRAAMAVPGHQVLFVGVTGLRMDDVDAQTAPTLWVLEQTGAVGTVVVRSLRTTACPADGWLAVSAGSRAADRTGACRTLSLPTSDGVVPGWTDYETSASTSSYQPRLGLLGDALSTAGVSASGIGPGAAVALADSSGRPVGAVSALPDQASDLSALVRSALTGADLLVVDLGSVPDGTARAAQVQLIDSRLRAVLDATSPETTVLIASIADSGADPHLQLAVATGPGAANGDRPYSGALLATRSTRQPGYLQSTDITPTLLTALRARADAPAGALVGSPVTGGPGPERAADRVAAMIDQDRHAQAASSLAAPFYVGLGLVTVVLFLLVSLGLDGRVLGRSLRPAGRESPRRAETARTMPSRAVLVLRLLRGAAVATSAVPVASFLANLSPWWRSGSPALAVLALMAGWVAVITTLALAPPWRRWLLGPTGVVAGITAVALAADIATGARWQISALMGAQPLEGARFYGFSNTAFALFAASSVLLAAAVSNPLLRRRRRLAVTVILAVGAAVTLIDGLPGLGSDFGGPPGLVPAFAVLALLAVGVRLTWTRIVGVLAVGAVVVISFAVLDWLRPADSRTHLGRFVQTVLDGGLWPVVQRKVEQNVGTVSSSPLSLVAVGGVALLLVLLWRPLRAAARATDGGTYRWLSAGTPLRRWTADVPMLRPASTALLVVLGIAALVNDSGVIILGVGSVLAFPLLVAAGAGWLLSVRSPSLIPTDAAPQL